MLQVTMPEMQQQGKEEKKIVTKRQAKIKSLKKMSLKQARFKNTSTKQVNLQGKPTINKKSLKDLDEKPDLVPWYWRT